MMTLTQWNRSDDAAELIGHIARCGAETNLVRAVCGVARAVLHLPADDRPRLAVEAVEGWLASTMCGAGVKAASEEAAAADRTLEDYSLKCDAEAREAMYGDDLTDEIAAAHASAAAAAGYAAARAASAAAWVAYCVDVAATSAPYAEHAAGFARILAPQVAAHAAAAAPELDLADVVRGSVDFPGAPV